MPEYQIIIERKECIKCGNCYGLDPNHFEPDDDFISMVVNGNTNLIISEGTFNDDKISIVEQVVDECPVEIISMKVL